MYKAHSVYTNYVIIALAIILSLFLVGLQSNATGLATGDPIEDNEQGLVALWHMNQGSGSTISDSSGNSNTGTINGSTWVDGKFGKALSFDGSNDYVEVSNSESLNITGNEITMEAWIKGNFPVAYKRYNIINKYNRNTGGYGLVIYRHTLESTETVTVYFVNSSGFTEGLCAIYAITPDTWYHVAFTWNSPNGAMYVNGVNVRNCSFIGPIAPNPNKDLWIGRAGGASSADRYWNGTIDEVAIYNRALSASEIENHYNVGMGLVDTISPTVSVAHSPASPTNATYVTITATASDNIGVTSISIYVNNSLAKTCSSSPCSTTPQTYSVGTHTYYATASDDAGNTGRDPALGSKSFTVSAALIISECGNDVKETGEECDGMDNLACPGNCLLDCTCYTASPVEVNFSGLSTTSSKYTAKFRGKLIFNVPPGPGSEGGNPLTTEEYIAQARYIGADAISMNIANWWDADSLVKYKSALQKYKDAGFLIVVHWNSHGMTNYNLRFNPPLHNWTLDNQHKQMTRYWRVYIDSNTNYGAAYKDGTSLVSHCDEWSRFHKCNISTRTNLHVTSNPDNSITVEIRNMTHYRPVYGPSYTTYTVASVYEKYPASEFSWLYDESGVIYDPTNTKREKGIRLTYETDYELFLENGVLYANISNPEGKEYNLYLLMYQPGFPSIYIPEGREPYFETHRSFLSNFSPYADAHMQNDGGFPVNALSGDFHPEIIMDVETKYGIDFNFDDWVFSVTALYYWDNKNNTQNAFEKENYLIFNDYAKEKRDLVHEYGMIYVPTASDMWGMIPAMVEHLDGLLINVWDGWEYRAARHGMGGPPTGWTSSMYRTNVWEAKMIGVDQGELTQIGLMRWTKNAADELLRWNPDGGTIYYWQLTETYWELTQNQLNVMKNTTKYFHDKFKHVAMIPQDVERYTFANLYPISYGYRYGDTVDINSGQIDQYVIYVKDLEWDSLPTDGCLYPRGSHAVTYTTTADIEAHEKISQAVRSGSGIASVFGTQIRRLQTHYTNLGESNVDLYKNIFQADGWTYTNKPNYTSHYLTFDGKLDPRLLNSSSTGKHGIKLKSGASVDLISGQFPYAGLYKTSFGNGRVIAFSENYSPFKTGFTDATSATYGDEYKMRVIEECAGKKGIFRLWDVGKTYLYKQNDTTYYALLVEKYGIARDVPVIVYGANYTHIIDMDTNEVIQNGSNIYLNKDSSKLLKISLVPTEEEPPEEEPPLQLSINPDNFTHTPVISDGNFVTVKIPVYYNYITGPTTRDVSVRVADLDSWAAGLNFDIDETGAMKTTTSNTTHLRWQADLTKSNTFMRFSVPPPSSLINSSMNDTKYTADINVRSIYRFRNVSATIPINSSYENWGLYHYRPLTNTWVDVTDRFNLGVVGDQATFRGFNTSNQQFRLTAEKEPTPGQPPQNGGGNGGGSGGGGGVISSGYYGGGVTGVSPPQCILLFGTVESTETKSIVCANANVYITKIILTAKNRITSASAILQVIRYPAEQITLSISETPVFAYLNIEPTNLQSEDLDKLEISFAVNKTWLTSNNLERDRVVLKRFVNNVWTDLETNRIEESGDTYVYSAESPGISYFAIAGYREEDCITLACAEGYECMLVDSMYSCIESGIIACDMTCPDGQVLIIETCECEEAGAVAAGADPIVIVLILSAVIILFFTILYKRKRKHHPISFPDF